MGSIYGNRRYRTIWNQLRKPGIRCHICGREIDITLKSPHNDSYSLDHIEPLAGGGNPFAIDNLKPAHRLCNSTKNKYPIAKGIIKRSGSA